MTNQAPKRIMPIIAVESVDQIRDFYVNSLGFDHIMGVVGKDGQLDFEVVVKEGASLMFSRTPGPATQKSSNGAKQPVEIYLEVDDVDRYHEQLKAKKVRITDPLKTQWWGDRTFKILDPIGYEVWFYQNVGEPKPPQGTKIV